MTSLPSLPIAIQRQQDEQFAQLEPKVAAALRGFLDLILEVRAEYGRKHGWRDPQVGYLMIDVQRPARMFKGELRRRYVHVILADRDVETGEATDRNPRVFCYVEATSGDIYKVSGGKVTGPPRGSIFDLRPARRAITPFGTESR